MTIIDYVVCIDVVAELALIVLNIIALTRAMKMKNDTSEKK